ncbi:MAG TPA: archaetidylserine decarboxylase [Gammaproteobacteria bacterium]|nr:archaetidylserine decarboxylase [Gammaproteobacteria bacterium]
MTSGAGVSLFQHLLPKDLISAVMYRMARSERRWIARPLIRGFARAYGVDLTDAEHADFDGYATFNRFFTRALKAGARVIEGGAETVVSPADGTLSEFGALDADTLLQAKGRRYSLAALLGESGERVDALLGGSYCTVYLSPRDYHRVHAPLDAALTRTRYIPGRRFSVSLATAAAIDRVFCRNERAVCWFDTALGPMVVVLVGALNVSSISTFAQGEIASGVPQLWDEPAPLRVARGAEIGRFNLGSTVIVLFARGAVRWDSRLATGMSLAMGSALGTGLIGPGR